MILVSCLVLMCVVIGMVYFCVVCCNKSKQSSMKKKIEQKKKTKVMNFASSSEQKPAANSNAKQTEKAEYVGTEFNDSVDIKAGVSTDKVNFAHGRIESVSEKR